MAKDEKKVKITLEVAEAEFERFAARWDLDSAVEEFEDEDDRKSFLDLRRRLVRKIMSGLLVVGGDGELSYELMNPVSDQFTSVRFKMPTGAAMIAWDKFKDRQNVHKFNAFLGACTGQTPAMFAKMQLSDYKVCQAVALLFLGS